MMEVEGRKWHRAGRRTILAEGSRLDCMKKPWRAFCGCCCSMGSKPHISKPSSRVRRPYREDFDMHVKKAGINTKAGWELETDVIALKAHVTCVRSHIFP